MNLIIKDLKVTVDGKEILKGVDLVVGSGEMHVLMGPNGSGKSTLAKVLAGSPEFIVHSGEIKFNGKSFAKLSPDKRAKMGIFLGFQHPVEVPGVSVFNFLRRAKQSSVGSVGAVRGSTPKANSKPSGVEPLMKLGSETSGLSRFRQELLEYASSLKLSDDFLRRSLNEGFSGGEKKRNEVLQMMALKPKLVILDEIDSGLDVDGLKLIAKAIKQFTVDSPQSSVILITHYARILKYLKPDFVHVMVEGKIVKSGTFRLAAEVEKSGYEKFKDNSKFLI